MDELCEIATLAAERPDPLAAVVLDGDEGFFVEPTHTAGVLDEVADAGWSAATAAIGKIDAPTIAVIRGHAVGAAWELALGCDLRLARCDAIIGSPDVTCGRMPQAGGTQRLVRVVGAPRALDLLLRKSARPAVDRTASSGVGKPWNSGWCTEPCPPMSNCIRRQFRGAGYNAASGGTYRPGLRKGGSTCLRAPPGRRAPT